MSRKRRRRRRLSKRPDLRVKRGVCGGKPLPMFVKSYAEPFGDNIRTTASNNEYLVSPYTTYFPDSSEKLNVEVIYKDFENLDNTTPWLVSQGYLIGVATTKIFFGVALGHATNDIHVEYVDETGITPSTSFGYNFPDGNIPEDGKIDIVGSTGKVDILFNNTIVYTFNGSFNMSSNLRGWNLFFSGLLDDTFVNAYPGTNNITYERINVQGRVWNFLEGTGTTTGFLPVIPYTENYVYAGFTADEEINVKNITFAVANAFTFAGFRIGKVSYGYQINDDPVVPIDIEIDILGTSTSVPLVLDNDIDVNLNPNDDFKIYVYPSESENTFAGFVIMSGTFKINDDSEVLLDWPLDTDISSDYNFFITSSKVSNPVTDVRILTQTPTVTSDGGRWSNVISNPVATLVSSANSEDMWLQGDVVSEFYAINDATPEAPPYSKPFLLSDNLYAEVTFLNQEDKGVTMNFVDSNTSVVLQSKSEEGPSFTLSDTLRIDNSVTDYTGGNIHVEYDPILFSSGVRFISANNEYIENPIGTYFPANTDTWDIEVEYEDHDGQDALLFSQGYFIGTNPQQIGMNLFSASPGGINVTLWDSATSVNSNIVYSFPPEAGGIPSSGKIGLKGSPGKLDLLFNDVVVATLNQSTTITGTIQLEELFFGAGRGMEGSPVTSNSDVNLNRVKIQDKEWLFTEGTGNETKFIPGEFTDDYIKVSFESDVEQDVDNIDFEVANFSTFDGFRVLNIAYGYQINDDPIVMLQQDVDISGASVVSTLAINESIGITLSPGDTFSFYIYPYDAEKQVLPSLYIMANTFEISNSSQVLLDWPIDQNQSLDYNFFITGTNISNPSYTNVGLNTHPNVPSTGGRWNFIRELDTGELNSDGNINDMWITQ